jgi:hypothetical protein
VPIASGKGVDIFIILDGRSTRTGRAGLIQSSPRPADADRRIVAGRPAAARYLGARPGRALLSGTGVTSREHCREEAYIAHYCALSPACHQGV